MSANTVINDTSRTLETLLTGSGLVVTVSSPQNMSRGSSPSVNLYLYQVAEHALTKNRPPISLDALNEQRPPLALSLLYMITPYAPKSDSLTQSEHLVLGRAMQVFYDNGLIEDPNLVGSLAGRSCNIRLSLCRMNLEEQTRIWNALQLPYRLSVCYEARVIRIDSTQSYPAHRVVSDEVRYEL